MTTDSSIDAEVTALAYSSLLAPVLFQPWAEHFADELNVGPGERVLDVACGTGVLASALAAKADTSNVTGLDLNPAMISVAQSIHPDMQWVSGSAEELPFDDDAFDVVVSQFGLMFFDAPERALGEMWRVLAVQGRLMVAVFDDLERNSAYEQLSNLYGEIVGADVRSALRFPFSLGNENELRALCGAAGIPSATVTRRTSIAEFRDARHVVSSDVKGWFPFAGIHLDEPVIDQLVDAVDKQLHSYETDEGTFRFEVSALVLEAQRT